MQCSFVCALFVTETFLQGWKVELISGINATISKNFPELAKALELHAQYITVNPDNLYWYIQQIISKKTISLGVWPCCCWRTPQVQHLEHEQKRKVGRVNFSESQSLLLHLATQQGIPSCHTLWNTGHWGGGGGRNPHRGLLLYNYIIIVLL